MIAMMILIFCKSAQTTVHHRTITMQCIALNINLLSIY